MLLTWIVIIIFCVYPASISQEPFKFKMLDSKHFLEWFLNKLQYFEIQNTMHCHYFLLSLFKIICKSESMKHKDNRGKTEY